MGACDARHHFHADAGDFSIRQLADQIEIDQRIQEGNECRPLLHHLDLVFAGGFVLYRRIHFEDNVPLAKQRLGVVFDLGACRRVIGIGMVGVHAGAGLYNDFQPGLCQFAAGIGDDRDAIFTGLAFFGNNNFHTKNLICICWGRKFHPNDSHIAEDGMAIFAIFLFRFADESTSLPAPWDACRVALHKPPKSGAPWL